MSTGEGVTCDECRRSTSGYCSAHSFFWSNRPTPWPPADHVSGALVAALIAWLDENARKCGHGYIHVTCGDCSPVRVQG